MCPGGTSEGGCTAPLCPGNNDPSIKTLIFMDGTRKISFPSIKTHKFMYGARSIAFPSIKQAVFMDGGADGVAGNYV